MRYHAVVVGAGASPVSRGGFDSFGDAVAWCQDAAARCGGVAAYVAMGSGVPVAVPVAPAASGR